jgi:hypothetical protein
MAFVVGMVSLAAPAWADSTSFSVIGRQDDSSRAGAEASYLFQSGGGSLHIERLDLHGEYVDPTTGLGVYAALPISHYSASDAGTATTSGTGVGDLDVGAIYALPMEQGAKLIFHGGVTLPSGSTGDDEITNVFGAFTRIDDLYLAIPHGFSLRLGVSPIFGSGPLTLRFDAGADINLSADQSKTANTIYHLNVGVGYRQDNVAVTAEAVNLRGDSTGNASNDWVDLGALSARLYLDEVTPYVAVSFPLDHDTNEVMNAVATLGIERRLR